MRVFAAAAMMIALAVAPAHAQGMKLTPGGKHHPQEEEGKDKSKPKVDEKDYRSALDRVPTQGSFDPWQNVREKPKTK